MKLGFVSAILGDLSLDEVVNVAARIGYSCVEVCCWPAGPPDRRYSGVAHIDAGSLDAGKASSILNLMSGNGVTISALGYYPNPLDPDIEKRNFCISHLKKVIDASVMLGIYRVNTFIGRDRWKNTDDNFNIFMEVWPPIIKYAEERNVRVGIENCPMFFTADEWPGGNNLATTPAIWRRMFNQYPSENFGLNYDPSHLLWQQIDYIKPLYEFRHKIFHVHLKDSRIISEKLDDVGIMGYPNEIHTAKIPGMGDINWGRFFSALNDIRYDGHVCVEVEDRAFEGSIENRIMALEISKRFLNQYV